MRLKKTGIVGPVVDFITMMWITLLLIFFASCDNKRIEATKTLDFGHFTMDVPASWEPIKDRGIDSAVGRIVIGDGDTLYFDLGWYSNSLKEVVEFKIENGDVYLISEEKSTERSVYYESVGKADTVDINRFIKNKVSWTEVDKRRTKLIQPKTPGQGTTGIYIDSLWTAGSGIDKFQLHGKDLKPGNEERVLTAVKTIRFIK